MNTRNNKLNIKLCFFIALICATMVLSIFYLLQMAPFGDRSMASGDINYSQLDLYSYLKNCLTGKDTFGYSFSMGLGGDTANVVAYGMSSPFNLLILFFNQENFHTYFDILVVIKIAAIGFCISFYLQKRFNGNLKHLFIIILSLSFALSQYCIAQIVNVFWLDGVALLPFILLGVYEVVREERPFMLVIAVLCSILFGWYTGITDCLFSIFWFVLEYSYYQIERNGELKVNDFFRKFIKFVLAGINGVLLSGFFFLPALASIRAGNRGSLNWESFNLKLNGNPLTVISNDIIGGLSDASKVCLFCGSVAIIGCIGLFMSKLYNKRWKFTTGIFLLFVIFAFYWQPLFLLFSMMKKVSSFWCRFSYIGIFTIVFFAAQFFSKWDQEKDRKQIIISSEVLWVFLIELTNIYALEENYHKIIFTCLATIITGTMLVILTKKKLSNKKVMQYMLMTALVFCVMFELGYDAKTIMNQYGLNGVHEYQDYVNNENKLIEQISDSDSGKYRISKSLCRGQGKGSVTANYNEPFGYNYMGLSSYTNSPNDTQRNLLNELGYRTNGENYYIVNTSIIPTDSLLGVKYFLSYYAINGYEAVEGMQTYNEKTVYKNPYALPLAFTYNDEAYQYDETNTSNPFSTINEIYSELYGKSVNLFIPVDYSVNSNDESTDLLFSISIPNGNYALYGNLPYSYEYKGIIKSGDVQLTNYAMWGAPSVFYIPSENGKDSTSIEVISKSGNPVSSVSPQFYALDLNMMKSVSEALQKNEVNSLNINGKHITMDVTLGDDEAIFTSIAYDKGWVITDNGKKIEPNLYENCLIGFKLETGQHHIELKYKQPGMQIGIVLTIIGCCGLMVWYLRIKKKSLM